MLFNPSSLFTKKSLEDVKKNNLVLASSQRKKSELAIKAATDFLIFREYVCGQQNMPHMQQWHEVLNTGQSNNSLHNIAGEDVSILAPRGSAKAQPYDSLVHTPFGFRAIGDLCIDSLISTADGLVAKIIAIHEHGEKDCYKVTFNDGTSCECSDEHIWRVRNLAGGDSKEFKNLSLNHIRTKVFVKSYPLSRGKNETVYRDALEGENPWLDYRGDAKYHIPVCNPVWMPEEEFIVHPYLLGVLLGDGSLAVGRAAFTTFDDEILENVKQVIPDSCQVKIIGKNSDKRFYSITNKIEFRDIPNIVLNALKPLKLYAKKSLDKFIPQIYLNSSIEQRVLLLQGLMDTDGYCSKDGSVCFSSISPRLINGVAHVVQSLGGVVRHQKPYYAAYKNSEGNRVKCQKSYAISINLPPSIKPFALTRKLARYKPRLKYLLSRGIVNIEYVGEKHMRCIETSDPAHLYLTNNFIVTHNSTWLCQWIAWVIGTHVNVGIALKIVLISYVIDVAAAKSRQIKSILESPAYQEVFPLVRPGKTKWGEREWQVDLDLAGIRTIDEPYTLVCSGLGGAIVSKRAHIIVFDDLIKQMSDAINRGIQDRMVDNYNNGIKYIRFPESRVINLGTRFAKYDIYNRIFVPPYYNVLKQSALLVNQYGEEYSFWEPDILGSSFGYPLSLLREERERNYESFLLQRQNEIPQESLDGIREEHIHYGWIPAQFDQLLIGVDLAGSVEKYSDCTAYCVIGIRDDVVYICDAWEEKIQGNLQKITKLYHYWEKWQSRCRSTATIAVDANKYSSLFRQDLEYYLDNLDKLKIEIPNINYDFAHIFIKDVASAGRGKEKIDRLNSHSGLFENGKVIFNLISEPEFPNGQTPIKKLVGEIIDFNSNESNDLMDSMEVAIYEGRQYIGNELTSA